MTMHKNVRKHLSEKLLTDHTLTGVVYAAYNYYYHGSKGGLITDKYLV